MPISSVDDLIVDQPPGQAHDAILQLLNRQVGDTFFSADAFSNAEAWNGIPIIYAKEHPDMEAFETDPEAELRRLRETTGRRADIVGHISDARIETTGHPKLMGKMELTPDPEVFQLIEAGTISPSTGFWCDVDAGSLKGSAVPNHVLIFEEDLVNQPRDRGAVILNKCRNMTAFTNEGKVLSGKNQSRLNEILQAFKSFVEELGAGNSTEQTQPEPVKNKEPDPVTNKMTDELIASKDAEIAKLKDQISLLTTEKEGFANKIAEIETASKEAAWTALKNKLPPGLIHKPEDEAAARDLFESDPFAFTNKLLDLKIEQPKGEHGQEFVNKDETDEEKANRILNVSFNIPGRLHS
ncbi:MAG: hypothetical protein M0Q91_09980 [Methanoregula sp.]|jgi:hypothetical protein|nr:hypothetical protein [Methanoregula sp.]